MRLLDTTTIKLSEFFDADIPPYVILSHTWGKNDVTFQDLGRVRSEGPQAYSKIAACCALASSRGFKWVWIDTCCIDKSSSAELSEAINSMFRWYWDSKECYAYLEDVSIDNMDQFGSSRWFTRGWTLQELLAPSNLYFYDKSWTNLGSKQDLRKAIALATNIPAWTVEYFNPGFESAAAKMSWASKRQTSRVEDTAYCLMGLFDINMPLLYGEGGKAFTRLQHEIVKNQDDESVFAWTDKRLSYSYRGMFARSPAAFANSGDVVRRNFDVFRRPEPCTVTSRGLSIQLICKIECNDEPTTEWVPLQCSRGRDGEPLMVKIRFDDGFYCFRDNVDALMEISESKIRSCKLRKVYIQ